MATKKVRQLRNVSFFSSFCCFWNRVKKSGFVINIPNTQHWLLSTVPTACCLWILNHVPLFQTLPQLVEAEEGLSRGSGRHNRSGCDRRLPRQGEASRRVSYSYLGSYFPVFFVPSLRRKYNALCYLLIWCLLICYLLILVVFLDCYYSFSDAVPPYTNSISYALQIILKNKIGKKNALILSHAFRTSQYFKQQFRTKKLVTFLLMKEL